MLRFIELLPKAASPKMRRHVNARFGAEGASCAGNISLDRPKWVG
jgi:hypothetical protein